MIWCGIQPQQLLVRDSNFNLEQLHQVLGLTCQVPPMFWIVMQIHPIEEEDLMEALELHLFQL